MQRVGRTVTVKYKVLDGDNVGDEITMQFSGKPTEQSYANICQRVADEVGEGVKFAVTDIVSVVRTFYLDDDEFFSRAKPIDRLSADNN